MPPKGSKALNRKNSCLSLFQKNKKKLNGIERKIFKQEESVQDKKKELELKQEEYNQLFNNINHKSNEVSIRILQQQAELLESFDASTMLCQSKISDRKRKELPNFNFPTLNSKFRTKQVSNIILNSKSKLLDTVKNEV